MLIACGEADSRAGTPEKRNELVFTTPDGATIDVTPRAVECGPSEYEPSEQVVRVRDFTKDYNLLVEVVPADVANGKAFDLPVDSGDMQGGPADAILFFGVDPDFEVSSSQEESTGTLEVLRASCDPAVLEMRINATLDSEYYDGASLEVEGEVTLAD